MVTMSMTPPMRRAFRSLTLVRSRFVTLGSPRSVPRSCPNPASTA